MCVGADLGGLCIVARFSGRSFAASSVWSSVNIGANVCGNGELWGGLGVGGVRVRLACKQKRWQDTLSASVKTSARPQAARECYTSYFAPRTLHFIIVLTGNNWGRRVD